MDTETIITLIIVVIGILWNLIVKMREKMTLPESAPPWSGQEEPAEMYEEDLSPYTIVSEEEIKVPLSETEPSSQETPFFLSGMKAKEYVYDTKRRHDSGRRKKLRPYKCISRSKLKEAIVWSEILAPPLSLRSGK